VLRSVILVLAMSSSCWRVSFPTLILFGSLEPDPGFFAVGRPAAFLIRTAAGGVFVIR
jgi:hypothetical protein